MTLNAIAAIDLRGPLLKLFSYATNPYGTTTMMDVFISFFGVLVILFIVFPIHECAHGFVAKLLGDDTAEREGRLTLNPFAHIDPMGALFMLIVPIGWGKPVPVNVSRCNKVKPKTAMALTSLAGPAANILLSYIIMVIYKIVVYANVGKMDANMLFYLSLAFQYIISLNLYLAVFNLFPVPPLDGSKILFYFLKPQHSYKIMQHQQVIRIVFYVLIFTGILTGIISIFSNGLYSLIELGTRYIELIML